MSGRLGQHPAVVDRAVYGHYAGMTARPVSHSADSAAPSLAKALAVIFAVTLVIGIASTYLLAAVRPSLFV